MFDIPTRANKDGVAGHSKQSGLCDCSVLVGHLNDRDLNFSGNQKSRQENSPEKKGGSSHNRLQFVGVASHGQGRRVSNHQRRQ